ncbi:hypothetical protein ACTFIW_013325 [Dictyostelium discoideum]
MGRKSVCSQVTTMFSQPIHQKQAQVPVSRNETRYSITWVNPVINNSIEYFIKSSRNACFDGLSSAMPATNPNSTMLLTKDYSTFQSHVMSIIRIKRKIIMGNI